MSTELAVDAVGVTKTFGPVTAVDDISIQVEAGEVYGVLGPNGAGKTTFLRMLFGLIRPDAGQIRVLGRSWDRDGIRTLDGVAGFIESPKFYPYLSGRQNLVGLARLDGGVRPGLIDQVLETVDMADRADRKVGGYSYGMRQRLGVAACLLREPRLLVLDEPANGLDPGGIRDMRALVKRLAESGLTVLLSSHHMDEVEEICDNVTIMSQGGVAFHGSVDELREMAPDPGYNLRTGDDARAAHLVETPADVVVALDAESAGLSVVGPQRSVSAYVAGLARSGIEIHELTPVRTPLEELFFMLTDSRPVDASTQRHPAVVR